MTDIHSELDIQSWQPWSSNIIFSDILPFIDSTVGKFEIRKNSNGLGLAEMKNSTTLINLMAHNNGYGLKGYGKNADADSETMCTFAQTIKACFQQKKSIIYTLADSSFLMLNMDKTMHS